MGSRWFRRGYSDLNHSEPTFKRLPPKVRGKVLSHLARTFAPRECRGCGRKATRCQPCVDFGRWWAENCLHCTTTGRCQHCHRTLPLPK